MEIYNTKNHTENVPIFMLLYGEGGIGKSTFAATAPGVFMADCEGGSKFFGRRGIHVVVGNIETWFDFAGKDQFVDKAISNPKVQTIVVDPVGELMEKCKRGLTGNGLTTADGQPTMRGWGELSTRMATQLRRLRDAGKNVILVAHVDEKEDDGRLVCRPLIQTKLAKTVLNMVDLVGYMYGRPDANGKVERVISFDPTDDKIEAKDRTDALDAIMQPDFPTIQAKINEYLSDAEITDTLKIAFDPQPPETETKSVTGEPETLSTGEKEAEIEIEPSFPDGESTVETDDADETSEPLVEESTEEAAEELARQTKLAQAKAKLKKAAKL